MSNSKFSGDTLLQTAVILIAAILTMAALKVGQNIVAPLLVALFAGIILAPITDYFRRLGAPAGPVVFAVLLLCILAFATLTFLAEPLIWRVADELPRMKYEFRTIANEFRDLIRGMNELNREVGQALGVEGAAADAGGEEQNLPSIADALFFAPLIAGQFLIFMGALFFFLLTREEIYDWLSRRIGSHKDTVIIRERFINAERLISRYFLTITTINLMLGVGLAVSLMLIGLPVPLVWGVAAVILNFVPYVGPMMVTAGLLLAGIVAFDGAMAIVPSAIFLILNMIESQFVTPSFVGRHISVNPLVVFLSLVFWLWLWGPLGGIIAIPVTVAFLTMLNVFDEPLAKAPDTAQP